MSTHTQKKDSRVKFVHEQMLLIYVRRYFFCTKSINSLHWHWRFSYRFQTVGLFGEKQLHTFLQRKPFICRRFFYPSQHCTCFFPDSIPDCCVNLEFVWHFLHHSKNIGELFFSHRRPCCTAFFAVSLN